MLHGAPNPQGSTPPSSAGGILGNLGGILGGSSVGGLLGGGIGELLEKFKQNGHGDTARSWIDNGRNQQIAPPDLKQAIGPDVLTALEKQTGLSQSELLSRLSQRLPDAVDQYTPNGQMPAR